MAAPEAKPGKASALPVELNHQFMSGESQATILECIGSLQPGQSVFFKTDGAWSNIELLEYLLQQTGPADLYFTTWSISAEAITRFSQWRLSGQLMRVVAVLDAGIRNRKPEIYQQATGVFPVLKVSHCHAKVTVIQSATHDVVLIGSANYTRNPRLEAGLIIWDKALAEENIKWILEEVYGVQ